MKSIIFALLLISPLYLFAQINKFEGEKISKKDSLSTPKVADILKLKNDTQPQYYILNKVPDTSVKYAENSKIVQPLGDMPNASKRKYPLIIKPEEKTEK